MSQTSTKGTQPLSGSSELVAQPGIVPERSARQTAGRTAEVSAHLSTEPGASTVDPDEIARFSAVADRFWDPHGPYRPLHKINPVRLQFIRDRLARCFDRDITRPMPFQGLRLLDIGCGGGLVAEPLARLGFAVTAIDAAAPNIEAARVHAEEAGVAVDYRVTTAEELAANPLAGSESGSAPAIPFDAVLALEIIEHVADIDAFAAGLAALVKPGGSVIVSTLNRTKRAFLLGIVAAEHVLRWVPRGTHRWRKFVRPSELARALRRHGLEIEALSGLSYDPGRDRWALSRDVSVNYLAAAIRSN